MFENWETKKNEEIKGWTSSSSLIPVNKTHLPTVYVCTKFQSFRPHSFWEKCDEKFRCWKLERKKNEEIKGWISSSSSLIPVYLIHLPTVNVCTKFHKGTNKQLQPDSSKHDTSAHCPRVYQVSIFQASQFLRKVWWKILFERSTELGDSIICLLKI